MMLSAAISRPTAHPPPRSPLHEYLRDAPEAGSRRVAGMEADWICVGHAHVQFLLQIGQTTILNPGSVGQPRDGDPRCAYAVIDDGRVEFKRVEYPVEETLRRIDASSLPDDARRLPPEGL